MIRRDLLTGHWEPYLLRAISLKPCYEGGINGGEVLSSCMEFRCWLNLVIWGKSINIPFFNKSFAASHYFLNYVVVSCHLLRNFICDPCWFESFDNR